MLKRVLSFVVLFLLLSVIPVNAATGIDYLNKQDLTKENATNLKTLALVAQVYGNVGNDILELKSKISSAAEKNTLPEQSYALLVTGDLDLAEQIVAKQNHDGSWEDNVYTTALTSYALFKNNLEVSSADSGLAYLESKQKENGSWNNSVQDTAVSLLALLQGSYNGQVEQQALDWLLLQQGGSWGSNVNTAWANLAFLEEGTSTDAVDNAVSFSNV